MRSSSIFVPYSLACIAWLLIACDDDTSWQKTAYDIDIVNLNDPYRKLASFSYSLSGKKAQSILPKYQLEKMSPYLQYEVSVHRFTYQTTYRDSVITASGVIAIPIGKKTPSLLVFHHGTLFDDAHTPSLFPPDSWGNDLLAACGYITLTPDYIGYGTSKDILHPYHLYQPTVDASIDMILQARKFLKDNSIAFADDGIFLSGFSEGGYAAFAVQKEIETHPEHHITIKASAPGAGAYDLIHQFNQISTTDFYPGAGYLILILTAYNQRYWHLPLSSYFLPPYDAQAMTWLDGTYSEEYLATHLPSRISDLVNPSFIRDVNTNPDSPFITNLKENNLNNFRVKSPTHFIHGKQDKVVPFAVAQKTYQDLIALGTDPQMVQVQSFEGGHSPPVYMGLMVEWFHSFE